MANQNFRVKTGLEVGTGVTISAGIVTAAKFVGDGSGLTNISSGGGTSSQWVTTAAGIHTLSNVGIGTTNPTSKLTIKGNTSLETLNVSGVSTFNSGTYFKSSTYYDQNPVRAYFGNSNELSIFSTGTYIGRSYNFIDADSGYIDIRNYKTIIRNPQGVTQRDLAVFDADTFNGEFVKLYYGGNEKFATIGTGVTVTGTTFTNQLSVSGISTLTGPVSFGSSAYLNDVYFNNNERLYIGNDTTSQLQIYTTAIDSFIKQSSIIGNLYIDTTYGLIVRGVFSDKCAVFTPSGSVELYYNNSKKFETLGTGVTVTGTTFTNQLSVSGVSTATSFSGSGASLTSLNASNISSGIVSTARLASGTADSTTYLRGDQTWVSISGGATLSNDTTTNATYYPTFSSTTSGTYSTAYVSNTKCTFNPSTGTLSATQFTSLSDRTQKTDINPIVNAIETVKQLQGVKYKWIDNPDKESIGVIAQDIEKVLPEVVNENSDGLKSVSYGNIVGLLIEAIKEQQVRIEELEEKLNA